MVIGAWSVASTADPVKREAAVGTADAAMGRYARGDSSAFDSVYEDVAPRLERFLRRHVREQARIEDIIQQTFLQMHAARGTFVVGAEVMPWALAIARRLSIDFDRKGRREEHLEMDDDELEVRRTLVASTLASGEELLQAREVGACLSAAYDRLSEPQRAAFELVKTEGLSHAQAALILGTSVSGIKLRVHRAYLALRSALGGEGRPSVASLPDPPGPASSAGLSAGGRR